MEIWQEIVADQERGTRRLVAECGDRMFTAAFLLCRDRNLAEDLVFRTFVYTIRSANEMGGLSTDEARVPIGATAISAPSDSAAEAPAYNLSGQRVSPAYRGMVISQGRKQMQR